jgi:hypothetical protein
MILATLIDSKDTLNEFPIRRKRNRKGAVFLQNLVPIGIFPECSEVKPCAKWYFLGLQFLAFTGDHRGEARSR